ncbi:hypothetical protein HY485_00905, partial [Candidatus Woesearchaeota archaeon]|nr:hypothetical protein [Candidatus Woesearchaeota archaeon]
EKRLTIPQWSGRKEITPARAKEIRAELKEKATHIKQDNGIITEVFSGTYCVDEDLQYQNYSSDAQPKNERVTKGLHLLIKLKNYGGEPFICYEEPNNAAVLQQFGADKPEELLGKKVVAYLDHGELLGCIGILPNDGQERHYNMSLDGHIHDLGWP